MKVNGMKMSTLLEITVEYARAVRRKDQCPMLSLRQNCVMAGIQYMHTGFVILYPFIPWPGSTRKVTATIPFK